MSLCSGDAGPGVWSRCRSWRSRLDARPTTAVSSGAQRSGDGATSSLAGSAVGGAQDGAELGAGQGDHVLTATLAAFDAVSPASRGSVR